MAKPVFNSADVKVDQNDPIEDKTAATIVEADEKILRDKDYQDRLAMAEEPVKIIINPAGGDNPPMSYYASVNGIYAEVLSNDQWIQIRDIPVGVEVVTKRKYVENLLRAKTERPHTWHENATVPQPRNIIQRRTSSVANVQVLEDRNPRGAAWYADLTRRNM